MTDPFEALREPATWANSTPPDPVFAERLRERITRALLAPETDPMGTGMTTAHATTAHATTAAGSGTPAADRPLHAVTPYLAVHDARAAIDWYVRALGAERRGEPIVMPDDRIGHAELAIGDSVLMLADEFPEIGVRSPRALGGVSQSLHLRVPDADATVARAADLGAEVTRQVADQPYGRGGVINDPFGHRWMIITAPLESAPADDPRPRHGDIGYASLWTGDTGRAADFYARVLGWRYAAGRRPSRHVEGVWPHLGIAGDQRRGDLFLCFAVDDVPAAARRVNAAGGQAGEPQPSPYGPLSDCVDDQGTSFAMYQRPDATPTTAGRSARHGELAYVTMEVVDSVAARAFYGSVLGWRFAPGSVADGWGVTTADGEQVTPMTGLHGGQDAATVVPMFAVDDIAAAVERVRAAGGEAPEPQRRPYGITAECTDDQGTRFYLGQLG